jgi:hypothetical protein
MADKKLLERIKKIQGLTHSSNVNEAATAAEMMQKLLFEHNVDIAEVERFEDKEEYIAVDQFIVEKGKKQRKMWQIDLAMTLASNNLCDLVYDDKSITWVGKPSNIEAARFMFETVVIDLTRICESTWTALEYVSKLRGEKVVYDHGKTWKNSFYEGAVNTISQRLTDTKKMLIAGDENVRALVVIVDQELKDALDELFPKLSHAAMQKAGNWSASGFKAGQQAGRSLQFQRGSGGTKLLKG